MPTDKPTFTAEDEQSAREAAEAKLAAEGILEQAGDSRAEQLARKAHQMVAEAQKLLDQLDIGQGDSSQIEIEREVRQALNELNEVYVSNQKSDHVYAWIYRDPYNQFGGRFVRKMQALGWETVIGRDEPEAKEHIHVDGSRVVADCVLMRIRLDRKFLLEKRDRILREAQQVGIVARIADLAERAHTRLYDKLPGFVEEAISSEASRRSAARTEFNRRNVNGRMDRMLRTGTIPGVPAPGAGR